MAQPYPSEPAGLEFWTLNDVDVVPVRDRIAQLPCADEPMSTANPVHDMLAPWKAPTAMITQFDDDGADPSVTT